MTRRPLLLDSPCTDERARFEDTPGGRYCHACEKVQYDLREATRSEVIALIDANGGRICGRLRTWPSGQPRFKPEPPTRGIVQSAAVAIALAACGSPPEPSVVPEPTTATPPPTIEDPPVSEIPVDPATPIEAVDHSTDGSPNLADHQQHRHTHPIVRGGGIGNISPDMSYGGGLAAPRGGTPTLGSGGSIGNP
jgi:hypothetical protein